MPDTNDTPTKKRSEKRKRELTLRCRVLPSECQEIEKRAKQMRISVSALLRDSALDIPVRRLTKRRPSLEQQELARLTAQLGKLGSELNKFFSIAERVGFHRSVPDLEKSLGEFRCVLSRLAELLT